jgi:hypothetical protein
MMKQTPILDSLEIRRFRVFRHLQIERLGRVNLITGKNNVGKTCLLEGLFLYGHRVSPGFLVAIRNLLKMRDETGLPAHTSGDTENQSVRHLFYTRKSLGEQSEPIQIGPVTHPNDMLFVDVVWYTERTGPDGERQWQRLLPEDYGTVGTLIPGLGVRVGERSMLQYPLDRDLKNLRHVVVRPGGKFRHAPCIFVVANGLGREDISQLWGNIALTDLEQDVFASLRIIASGIERVNLVGDNPMVKIAELDSPLPLRSLGEGMNRLFGIVLALVNAQNGMLLVDEIGSGLHYSVQPDLWRLVFQVARRLNVQVFATTHSWDCIEAFQEAAQEQSQDEGMLISLRKKKDEEGRVVAVLFDEEELGIVTREQIEVR